MFVRPVYHAWHASRWVEILTLAIALALALATAIGAAGRSAVATRPGILPGDIQQWSKPLAPVADRPATPQVEIEDDAGVRIWRALQWQADGQFNEAAAAWSRIELPADTQVWKYIALGQALLAADRLDEAEQALGKALELRADHPVVHFYFGVLRLEQAFLADEWPDALGTTPLRLVVHAPPRVTPNTRSMFELTAAMEFEKCLLYAEDVWLDEPLLPPTRHSAAALEPTVRDLLLAIGAEQFEGKAHHCLGHWFLERGQLVLAEEHLDAAVGLGMTDVGGYANLGDEYQAQGQFADATRAYLKALKHGQGRVGTVRDLLHKLREPPTGK